MKGRERVLTALELACFAAVSLGAGLFGAVVGGSLAGLATLLVCSGASGVYLVNAYSVELPKEGSPDAKHPPAR